MSKLGITKIVKSHKAPVITERYILENLRKNYGKVTMGTLRKTFVFDEAGRVVRIIEKVDTKNHSEQIL